MRVSMSVAEMGRQEPSEPPSPGDATQNSARPADRHGLLKHSCGFLDFWDIAKPEQETRLAATKLPEYLRARPKMERRGSEMKYTLKRLITGLGVWRENTRPCYSLALAQLLQSFEDLHLCSILQQIQEKYDLHQVKKVREGPGRTTALFADLFRVLALFQSGWLVKVRTLGGRWGGGCRLVLDGWGTLVVPAHTLCPSVGTRC
uniref:myb-binding protein 1A-like n=1 Tax=Callithrix jacchus TaxID=9483 RepID=UPI0023DD494C|nr:myb-binding protein 1A-like [Callithrix jacchus]